MNPICTSGETLKASENSYELSVLTWYTQVLKSFRIGQIIQNFRIHFFRDETVRVGKNRLRNHA